MSLQYVIDGYNIINNNSFRSDLNKFKDCRIALLEIIRLNKLTGSTNNEVIAVFDGYPPYPDFHYDYSNFKVIFSCDVSADQRIKDILEASLNPKNIVVVSDDKEVRFFASGCRAKIESVVDFLGRAKNTAVNSKEIRETILTYTEVRDINEELKKKWLK